MVHLKKFIIVFVVAAFRSRPQFFIIFHSAFTEQKIESGGIQIWIFLVEGKHVDH